VGNKKSRFPFHFLRSMRDSCPLPIFNLTLHQMAWVTTHMTSSQINPKKLLFFSSLSFSLFIYLAHEISFAFNSSFGYQCLTRTSPILQVRFGNGGLNVDGIRLIRGDVSSPPKPVNTLWCLTNAILSQRGVWR